MIKSFKTKGTEDIARGINSKSARKILPVDLQNSALMRIGVLDSIKSLEQLIPIHGFKLHKLSRDRRDQYAIRINDQFRICFVWDGKDAHNVEVIDYH